jgi:hypothetical protein
VGTAKNDLVDAGGEQRGQMLACFLGEIGVVEAQAFDAGGPAGAGLDVDLYAAGVLPDQLGQALAARRRQRCQYGDAAAARAPPPV